MAWAGNVNGATLRELGWRGAPRDGPHFLSQGGKSRFQQLFSARDDIAPPPPTMSSFGDILGATVEGAWLASSGRAGEPLSLQGTK